MAENAYKYVTYDNLNHFSVVFYQAVAAKIPTKTSQLSNDSNFAVDAAYVHTDSNYTQAEKEKLAGVEAGANKTTVTTTISSTDGNPVASSAVALALANKVDSAEGKGLSTNDLTDDLVTKINNTATKVEGLAASGGEPNTIDTVKVNGTALTPDENKAVDITVPAIPTLKVNGTAVTADTENALNVTVPTDNKDIANGAGYQTEANVKSTVEGYGYQTAAQVESTVSGKGYQTAAQVKSAVEEYGYQTAAQVDTAITGKGYQTADQVDTAIAAKLKDITGISFEVVTELPETGKAGTIYLIAHAHGTQDAYDEYVYIESSKSFEKLGNTDIDLSGYVLKSDLVAITNEEIDTMVANATTAA